MSIYRKHKMRWTLHVMSTAAFLTQIAVIVRISVVEICRQSYFVDTYACKPFPQFVAEMIGCTLMGLASTIGEASKRRHMIKTDDESIQDLPCMFADENVKDFHFIFKAAFAAVLTSFSAWIVSSARYYYRGEWVNAIFTIIVPGSALFMLFLIGEDIGLFVHRRFNPIRYRACFNYILKVISVLFGILAWIVAVCASGSLVFQNATHWLSAALFAPLGAFCRIIVQENLNNTGRLPYGTLLCNAIACLCEALVLVYGGDDGIFLGIMEGLIASFSTVSSVVSEVVHGIPSIHEEKLFSGFFYFVLQVFIGTLLPLIVFWAVGRDHI